MSNLFYPLGLVSNLVTEKHDRTLVDDFTDGSTQSRTGWPLGYLKRKFTLSHSPLTSAEFQVLRGFYSQMGGTYDTFTFRDNVHREGSATVRFSQPFKQSRSGSAYLAQIELLETAPKLMPLSVAALTAAAGVAPLVWFDSSREIYYQHMGAAFSEPAAYDTMVKYPATWQAGSLNLGSSWKAYNFTGVEWAKTATMSELASNAPAMTFFCLASQSTTAASQLLFSVGTLGLNKSLGLCLDSDVYYMYLGDLATSISLGFGVNNSPTSTWRSIAMVCDPGTSNLHLYGNASSAVGTSYSHSFVNGPFVIGADPAGANILNPSNGMANCALDHILLFPAALSAAQIKAVHNLLAPYYSIALVP